ncbi:chemotaxis protein CheA [Eleftheria terrae]|uniref:chemotaxis protein CheA n=1 Tax=Eleftheria terrae TaxID=1597781 RepID=UPI00263A86D7|nr:chemotaxis protein CheA [Eleftheria terrae]WKB56101.1 chemotaxis protein CheA [Eleftheria terrae]
MNTTELLDQFVTEAREGLEAIGERLLEVERNPADAALLNDLFRLVHTLKGNCGLFEFKPLERVVHAGEDLLDRVRQGKLPYGPELADALLDAMDYSAELIDRIEREQRLDTADARADALAKALRALLPDTPALDGSEQTAHAPAAAPPQEPPAWLTRIPANLATNAPAGATALRYLPEPDCFFKGEDPWRLALTAPGLLHAGVAENAPWPQDAAALADWDCYRCNLDIVLVSAAAKAELEQHFRCVPEQVEWHGLAAVPQPAAGEAPPALRERASAIWHEQLALLSRPSVAPHSVEAARRALRGLLCAAPWADSEAAMATLDALPRPLEAAALAAWASVHGPAPRTAAAVPDDSRRTEESTGGERTQRVLKVGQEKVDRLMDLIGEMVVAKNGLPYLAQRAETTFGQRELAREIKAQYGVIHRIAEDMQRAIMEVRMLPVGVVFQRFGRLVRDLSRRLGKEVQLLVEGEDTEADKNVIEALADPLIHILRNSLDHGIEQPAQRLAAGKPAHGTIRITARQEGDRVVIEIADDGAGVNAARVRAKAVERGLVPEDRAAALSDEQAVQLIFLPGFSTADTVSDLSGRGVGMDVVRTAVERVNGQVTLSSRPGLGTSLRLSLPLSMAVSNVMVIESAGRRFGVPMDLIVETVRVHGDDIHHFKQARTTVLRGRIVPLRELNDLLALDAPQRANDDGELAVLVVRLGAENVGLVVDQFHGASDIILKPLEGVLAGMTGFAGTALMGDGGVLMILNPKELL